MKISVLQWNVWTHEKADNVLRFIKQADADILCLQELTTLSPYNGSRNEPAEIAALGYQHIYAEATTRSDYCFGNGIFSKFPVLDSRQVYVQHENPKVKDAAQENRIYVEAKIKAGDKQFTIGTVHLSYTDEFKITEARKREVDKLTLAIKDNATNFILAGDMNAKQDSYIIDELEKVLKPAGPNYGQPTFTTKPFSLNGFVIDTLDWRLDYVFTTPDVKILSSEILKTEFSDHLPILTEIEI